MVFAQLIKAVDIKVYTRLSQKIKSSDTTAIALSHVKNCAQVSIKLNARVRPH